ncbi:helix-turn-helix transcriptional regulator [Actinomadura barringtoniae]|uniref:Helix-turn-helix transcriptional regulator n=1 Tax=Actinomadura barringtoniae TaxID=1427535 RepID=A0A939PH92_9ACTN|nr:helix-turn-helix transcriptional regulator [Actinomadura barringtoniae]MBO2449164.1 helix-turn-helix transcriptional regulator [Actinomadura barringtoniae]
MPARSEPYDAPAIITFAKELTAWRENVGLSKKELGDALGYADSYIGQIEHCKNIPSEEFAEALDTFFKTNGLFHRLWQRIVETRHAVSLPPGFPEFLKREKRAIFSKYFCLTLVSGMFQTEDYARAVMEARDKHSADEFIAKRMERQSILTSDSPPQVLLTLDERVLREVIGSRDVQRRQLQSLLEASELPNVAIDVVPQGRGYYPGLTGSLTILSFSDGANVAYTESQGVGTLIELPSLVTGYIMRYELIKGCAHPVSDSRTVIRAVMEEL